MTGVGSAFSLVNEANLDPLGFYKFKHVYLYADSLDFHSQYAIFIIGKHAFGDNSY